MLYVIREAVCLYKDYPDAFARLRKRAMSCDFSWSRSAKEYLRIYAGITGQAWPVAAQESAEEKPARKRAAKTAKKAEAEETAEKPVKKAAKKPAAKKEPAKKETKKKGTAAKAVKADGAE